MSSCEKLLHRGVASLSNYYVMFRT
uniref:Uncharacterized protein n=1 Tax=Romanomermis culicivorax TaxID=13658 RepID=A0A915KA75_ROMCU